MHVCDVTMLYAAESGGVRRYVDTKRAWLRQHPEHSHTLMIPAARSMPPEPWTIALRSVPLPLSHGYRVPLGKGEVTQKLLRVRPSVIEAGDPYHLAWAVLDAAVALDVPSIAFCHSDLPEMLGRRYGVRAERMAEKYVHRLYEQFDLVLAPSLVMTEKLRSIGIRQAHRQRLGVDLQVFKPARRNAALREALGVDVRSRLLVYAGRFAPEKNLPLLFQALRSLGERYTLVLVGAGALPPNVPHNVRVLRFIRDRNKLATLLAGCDAFVHAGAEETFGLAALEAMACGLPIIGTHAAGIGELVSEEVGVLVQPHSAAAMAAGIAALFERDLPQLGARARAIAHYYDWESVLPELLQRYRGLRGGAASVRHTC